jgi:hypothetical protein
MVMVISTQGLSADVRQIAEGNYLGLPGGSNKRYVATIVSEDDELVRIGPKKVAKKKMPRKEVNKSK